MKKSGSRKSSWKWLGVVILCLQFFSVVGQVPQPVYPADGASTHIFDTLRWTVVPNATKYDVTTSTNINFTAIRNHLGLTSTILPLTYLDSDREYFWRVRAVVGGVASAWSPTFSFKTATPGFKISPPLTELNLTNSFSMSMADLTGTAKEIICLGKRSSGHQNVYRLKKEGNDWIILDSVLKSLVEIDLKAAPVPVDMDNDGDLDLIFRDRTFWNDNGQFQKINSLQGAIWGDHATDRGNDGWFDMFLAYGGFSKNNGNRSLTSGLPNYMWGMANGHADFDKDNRIDWVRLEGLVDFHHPKLDTTGRTLWLGLFTLDPNRFLKNVAVGDINSDGWVDIVTVHNYNSGTLSVLNFDSVQRNFKIATSLFVGSAFAIDLADLNNDGRLDLIYGDAAKRCLMVCWNVNGNFNLAANSMPLFGQGLDVAMHVPAVGDIDGDNDVDIVIDDNNGGIRILENIAANINSAPQAPVMKRASFSADTIYFSWERGTDAQQNSISLQYNLRVGKTKRGSQVLSAGSDSITGVRYVYLHPTASQNTTWMLKTMKPGLYYYAVQSIDASRMGSPFSNIDSVYVCAPNKAIAPTHPLLAADTSLLFQWTTGLYANSYQLQVAYDNQFFSIARDVSIPDTVLFVRNLPIDTTLFWRVRPVNENGQAAWTATREIDTRKIGILPTWNYSRPICSNTSRGMTLLVSAKGAWESGNQFILEASDYTGSFANGRVLATISDSIAPEYLRFTCRNIPFTNGDNYRLRVRTTQPALTSATTPPFGIRNSTFTVSFFPLPVPACFGTNATLQFNTLSGSADSSIWYRNYTRIARVNAPGRSITISQPGYYTVEANISDLCIGIDSIVYSGIDCYKVWPGDANSDSRVDELDIFTIGRNNNKAGTARSDQGIEWRGYDATPWQAVQANYFNLKHADANGDGTVNATDTTAVSQHFGLTHLVAKPGEAAVDSLRTTISPFAVKFDKTSYSPGQLVTGTVIMGSAAIPLVVSGVTFNLEIPDTFVEPGSLKIYTDSSGLFYTNGPSIYLFKGKKWIVHTANNKYVKGYGSVARFSFILKNVPSGTSVTAAVENIILTDLNGKVWTSLISNPGTIMVAGTVTGINTPLPAGTDIAIHPNPIAEKTITIRTRVASSVTATLRLYNETGQCYGTKNMTWSPGNNVSTWSLSPTLKAGNYYMVIRTKKWTITRKIVVL